MTSLCPVCKQALPKALSNDDLAKRLQSLSASVISKEKQRLREEFEEELKAEREVARKQAELKLKGQLSNAEKRLQEVEDKRARELRTARASFDRELEAERKKAQAEAQLSLKKKIEEAEKRAIEAERNLSRQAEVSRREMELRLRKEIEQAVKRSERENESKLERLEAQKLKESLRHEVERAKLQSQLENLTRKVENKSGERLGDEGELDLHSRLRQMFPEDRIERVDRGAKGADIVHHIRDGSKTLGRIVYESKNVGTWNNSFVIQAKKYQVQYETPHVMIVSRVFPKKEKDLCIAGGIPVVKFGTAAALASIMRQAIIEIGHLRLSSVASSAKGQQLFEYLTSEKFTTRFAEIVQNVESLRQQQRKEKDWHEDAWELRAKLHDKMETRHREIDAHMRSVLRGTTDKRILAMSANA